MAKLNSVICLKSVFPPEVDPCTEVLKQSFCGWGGGHPDPEIRGRPGLKTIFFSALRASLDPLLLWHVPVVAGFTVQILHIPVTYCFIFFVGRSLT